MIRAVHVAAAWALTAASAAAQTSFPMVTHCTPIAVQRGTTVEVTVEGQQNLAGTVGWLTDGPGLTAAVVASPPPKDSKAPMRSVKLRVTADKDAPLGVREFRLISTVGGASSVGQLVVTADPVVTESAGNNTPDKATSLPAPGVASGRIEALEDVDVYKVRLEAGQKLAIEVYGARIHDKIHDLQKHLDPIVTLYDAAGRELAANDDYYFADPLLTWTAAAAGDYFVQVRDSKYDGDPRWAYALCVTTRPYAAHVHPMAANPGQTVSAEPIGPAAKVAPHISFTAPTAPGLHAVPLPVNGSFTNPTALAVTPLPLAGETEPNDAPAQAQRLAVPSGVTGRVGQPRDLDYFTFSGQKGKAIRFEMKARRFGTPLQSSLDSVLEVLNARGTILAANDDDPGSGKDAALTFTPPADGDYTLRLRDLNGKGGPSFVYLLEADFPKPTFALRCDPARASIGPGGHTAWHVHVARQNGFDGPVKIDVTGLPAGVAVNPLTIPPSMTQGLLVLSAAPDATPGAAAAVQVVGSGVAADGHAISHVALSNEEIYLPGGGRGRFDVNLQAVAVTEPLDVLAVKVTPSTVTLKPGQEVKLDVKVERKPGFTGGLTLDVPLRHLERPFSDPLPPGVTLVREKSKTLLGTGSAGHIVLRAAPDAAPISAVPINVSAYVSINFVVKMGYSSAAIPLTVEKK